MVPSTNVLLQKTYWRAGDNPVHARCEHLKNMMEWKMENTGGKAPQHESVSEELKKGAPKPRYEKPRIVTYTNEQLVEQIGPALTCVSPPGSSPGFPRY